MGAGLRASLANARPCLTASRSSTARKRAAKGGEKGSSRMTPLGQVTSRARSRHRSETTKAAPCVEQPPRPMAHRSSEGSSPVGAAPSPSV